MASSGGSKAAGNDYFHDDGYAKVQLFEPVEPATVDSQAGLTVRIAESLLKKNYAVMDGLLGAQEAMNLRAEVARYYKDGLMVDGEIGQGVTASTGSVKRAMRTDKVVWFEGSEAFVGPSMKRHITRMDIITQKVAILLEAIAPEQSWTGARRSKIMATVYAGSGAKYVPHYDNPNRNGRRLTAILYLNPEWKPQHGGTMRMKTQRTVVDVAPLLDRMLFFWSDTRCPHEVLPATGPDRYAITIWFMDEKERFAAEADEAREDKAKAQMDEQPPARTATSVVEAAAAAAEAQTPERDIAAAIDADSGPE